MAVTPAEFKVRYPEFDSVDDARVQLFLDDATLEMSVDVWGDLYDRGQGALAAHYLAIGIQSEAGGGGGSTAEVTSKKIGDVSYTYSTSSSSGGTDYKGGFDTTVYGRDYLNMVSLVGTSILAIT